MSDAAPGDPWPRDVSRRPTMRISDVLAALSAEFPGVTHSKLRFWEDQGLIDPVRTPAGYRQYSPADVERLRFVLVSQRDRYLPLKVIKQRLDDLDRGIGDEPVPDRAPELAGQRTGGEEPLTAERLAARCGVDLTLVRDLIDAGVLRPGPDGALDPSCAEVVAIAAKLADYGIEPRHLRTLRTASERHVTLIEQVVAPWTHHPSAPARDHARVVAEDIGDLCIRLHTAWVHAGTANLIT